MQTQIKFLALLLSIISLLFFNGCDVVVVNNAPGSFGRDGLAFFGVDYETYPPYSYWDDNAAIPYNPELGYYYETAPGTYNFEYFVNPSEYWYGTYEIWINPGMPGEPNGVPGADGMDTYFMLMCDPNGYHMHYDESYKTSADTMSETIPVVIEKREGKFNYRLTIQKGNVNTRPAHQPKFMTK